MYGIFHIRSVSVGLDSQIWYLFIYITGYLNVRKISETMDFRTFVGPLPIMMFILPLSSQDLVMNFIEMAIEVVLLTGSFLIATVAS